MANFSFGVGNKTI